MNTISITHIYEMGSGTILCSLFRHWAGDSDRHLKELERWLKNKTARGGVGEVAIKLGAYMQRTSHICEIIPSGSCSRGMDYVCHVSYKNGKFKVEML